MTTMLSIDVENKFLNPILTTQDINPIYGKYRQIDNHKEFINRVKSKYNQCHST